MNQFDWTGKWATYQGTKIAITEFETNRSVTYAQLNNLACFAARLLSQKFNIGKGDRIAILAENSLELIVLFAAAQKNGMILIPLNYRLTAPEIAFQIRNCEPKLIITEEKFNHCCDESDEYVKEMAYWKMDDFSQQLDAVLSNQSMHHFENELFDEHHPIFLIYTSGTTAFPKASIYTHKMLFWNSINTQLRLNITADDRSINCAPSFHTGSWNVLLTPFLHHGAFTLLMRKFEPETVLHALEKYESTIWWAVPTMLKMICDSPAFETLKLAQLRYLIVGGEAMPIPLIEQWHRKKILIRQGYGLTEVGPNVTSLNHEDAVRKQGSIGKPNFYYEVRIINENGFDANTNEMGELLLKGPTVTPGYWNNEKATNETIIDGWFHTGDLVTCDSEGYIYVVDRLKNMYISGGENVYPAEVEFQLRSHPAIDSVAIVGVPDEKWGEAGMAFICCKTGKIISSDEIIAFCVQKLAKYKIPKHIRFLAEMPKNDAGKIDRKMLKFLSQETINK